MKWVKLSKDFPNPSAEQEASYDCYTEKEINDRFGLKGDVDGRSTQVPAIKHKNLWVRHRFGTPLTRKQQRDYEIFCGGFLQFYDIEVRNKATNHQLYFEWTKNTKEGYFVAIYLFPKPLKKKNIPKDLTAQTTLQARLGESKSGPSDSQIHLRRAAAGGVAPMSDDDEESIDPPPPPPPPPPPRE